MTFSTASTPSPTPCAGSPAQGVDEGVDAAEHVVGELLDLPDALLAIRGQGEVDSVGLVRHVVPSLRVGHSSAPQRDRPGRHRPTPALD